MEPNNIQEPTREELEELVRKAQKELEERLAQMTPEERREAEIRARKMIEEDEAKRQRLLDFAAKISAKPSATQPKFCPNCGAPISGGKFCIYCGSPLSSI
ncbi:MAG: hypothetical protein IJH32_05805 [Ruminococcus sp.]|nr:hypothetical protein [Ruminococcus sp.]